MKHYGDITKIKGSEVPIVDIICGGSPCQDLSVAGQRKGLQHSSLGDEETTRSGLFMEQIRIVKEQRDECIRQLSMRGSDIDLRSVKPRFLIWENVPGTFSSNKGADFRCVLEEICRIADKTANVPMPEKGKWSNSGCIVGDGWSVGWRVHDSQFWGVPQRRRRISVVADFGSESVSDILFERESVSGDSKQSLEEGKEVARATGECLEEASNVFGDNIMPTLVSRASSAVGNTQDGFNVISFQERAGCPGGGKGILIQNEKTASLRTATNQSVCCYGMDNERRRGVDEFEEMSPTVTSRAGTGGNNIPVVIEQNETVNVEMEVSVRKYDVDKEKLKECLQSHRTMPMQVIAELLGKPKTRVEHWFRNDESFAIPDPDTWMELKTLLGIETSEFDESIMTFETKPGNYDMRNRIHTGEISPTLKAGTGNDLYCVGVDLYNGALTGGTASSLSANTSATGINPTVITPRGGQETVGALCARDYKGLGSQDVEEGKIIIQPRDNGQFL